LPQANLAPRLAAEPAHYLLRMLRSLFLLVVNGDPLIRRRLEAAFAAVDGTSPVSE
jgi:hypothetical protein